MMLYGCFSGSGYALYMKICCMTHVYNYKQAVCSFAALLYAMTLQNLFFLIMFKSAWPSQINLENEYK